MCVFKKHTAALGDGVVAWHEQRRADHVGPGLQQQRPLLRLGRDDCLAVGGVASTTPQRCGLCVCVWSYWCVVPPPPPPPNTLVTCHHEEEHEASPPTVTVPTTEPKTLYPGILATL